jgi:predicted nucleic acid-binding protein
MNRIIDANFGVRLVISNPQQLRYREVLRGWQTAGSVLLAPTLWLYEVTSAITKALRFGDLAPDEGRRALATATALDVTLVPPDADLAQRALEWTLRLGRAAAYDSFYLALAERLRGEFWTADGRLSRVAGRSWVRWLDGPGAA